MKNINVADVSSLMADLWLRHQRGLSRARNNVFEVMFPPLDGEEQGRSRHIRAEGTQELEDALWESVGNLIEDTIYD